MQRMHFGTFREKVRKAYQGNGNEAKKYLYGQLRDARLTGASAKDFLDKAKAYAVKSSGFEGKLYNWRGEDLDLFESFASRKGDGDKAAAIHFYFLCHPEFGKFAAELSRTIDLTGKLGSPPDNFVFGFPDETSEALGASLASNENGRRRRVYVGPITISFDDDPDLIKLSLQIPPNPTFMTDGMPDVFAALDWRSRLSGLHGREEEFERLIAWAKDDDPSLKVMLVSGPGGAGKSRLAADAVAQLVHKDGWLGGIVGDARRPIKGGSRGIALIIDYPEERTTFVTEVLKAVALARRNDERYACPLRLILVSRETRDTWATILNEPVGFIAEIRLDLRAQLPIDEALAIVDDIAIEFPRRLGRQASNVAGARAWLQDPSHRLPLNVVAVSIHAVLDPDNAFKLDNAAVLDGLVNWEMRRVRYYSKREIGDEHCLEKLLALSLFTSSGLTKNSILKLWQNGIAPDLSANDLIKAVGRTPFWLRRNDGSRGSVVRLEPDRVAAVFLAKALDLVDPSPTLEDLVLLAAIQDFREFYSRLSRLIFDVRAYHVDSGANLEICCVNFIRKSPSYVRLFGYVASDVPSIFVTLFSKEISSLLIAAATSEPERFSLMINHGAILYSLQEYDEALFWLQKSLKYNKERFDLDNAAVLLQIAQSLNNIGAVKTDLHQFGDALRCFSEAEKIYNCIKFNNGSDIGLMSVLVNKAGLLSRIGDQENAMDTIQHCFKLFNGESGRPNTEEYINLSAEIFNSLYNILSNLGQTKFAMDTIRECVRIHCKFSKTSPDKYLPKLGNSLSNWSISLNNAGLHRSALNISNKSLRVYHNLSLISPDPFESDFASTLSIKASALLELGQLDAALNIVNDAVIIHRRLVSNNRSLFLPELSKSLKNLGAVLFACDRNLESLTIIEEVIEMRLDLARSCPAQYLPDVAVALRNKSAVLMKLKRPYEALAASEEAVNALRARFFNNPTNLKVAMRDALDNYKHVCRQNLVEPRAEFIETIEAVFLD